MLNDLDVMDIGVSYLHLLELIFSFLMVFILSQLDIYIEKIVIF